MNCQNCGKRPGTHKYGEGAIAAIHGCYAWWCEVCVLTAQIEHAENAVDRLPALRARLAELLAPSGGER